MFFLYIEYNKTVKFFIYKIFFKIFIHTNTYNDIILIKISIKYKFNYIKL